MSNATIDISTVRFLVSLLNEQGAALNDKESKRDEIVYTFPDIPEVLKKLDAYKTVLSFERYSNGIKFELDKKQREIFFSIQNFLERFLIAPPEGNFAILLEQNSFFFYDANTNEVHDKNGIVHSETVIHYARAYKKIKELLSNTDGEDKFCSYHDTSKRRLVVLVPEKGRTDIEYGTTIPEMQELLGWETLQASLEELFRKTGFIQFFKSAVFDALKNVPIEQRFTELIKSLSMLIETANSNFEVYLSGFSFKKLADELRKEKEEYFKSTRELLNKLYTQVITIPLSFSVAVFAGKSVEGLLLFMIVAGFIIYSAFVGFLLGNLYKEIQDISDDFDEDRKKINDAFLQYAPTKAKVEGELDKIQKRIRSVKRNIDVFGMYVFLVALSIIIASWIQHSEQLWYWIIAALTVCIIATVMYFVVWKPQHRK